MPVSEAQKQATARYKKKSVRRVSLEMPIEEYENMKAHCDTNNESVNGFLRRIIKENIKS